MKSSEVLRRIGEQPFVRLTQQFFERIGESGAVAVWKCDSTRPDRFRQTAAARADHGAAACDPFQGYDAERLVVARWDNKNLVSMKNGRQLVTALRANEIDLRLQS